MVDCSTHLKLTSETRILFNGYNNDIRSLFVLIKNFVNFPKNYIYF